MGDVELEEHPTTSVELEEGDHDRFSHYARRDHLSSSSITGLPVKAFCGKIWVPTKDPSRFQICPACAEEMKKIKAGRSGMN